MGFRNAILTHDILQDNTKTKINMKELRDKFTGIGEVKNYVFTLVTKSKYGYVYEVTHPEGTNPHYEVFKRKENTRFNTVSYPSSKAFGLWAWTYPIVEWALERLHSFTPSEEIGESVLQGGISQDLI